MKNAGKSMYRSRNSWRRAFMDGLWGHNVVLAGGTGLYLIISGGRTIRSALLLSVLVFCMVVPLWLLGSVLCRKTSPWLRLPLIFMAASVLYLPLGLACWQLFPSLVESWGLCGAVLSGNALFLTGISRRFLGQSLRSVLGEAMGSAAGFSCVLLAVSLGWKLLDGMGMQEGSTAFDRAPVLMVLLFLAVLAAAAQYWKNRNRKKQKGKGDLL